MALWKENMSSKPSPTALPDIKDAGRFEAAPATADFVAAPAPTPVKPRMETDRPRKESLIAADLTIEGKIEGAGSVRIAGRFKGDVNVQGDLTIEAGAKLTGSVRAQSVVIAGELEGNVEGAARVELQQSGVVTGDVKAGTLTVASGARMRGQAVFGWDDETAGKPGNGSRSETVGNA
jgi:cytoskeletal protein CcmA (bactofilin family)